MSMKRERKMTKGVKVEVATSPSEERVEECGDSKAVQDAKEIYLLTEAISAGMSTACNVDINMILTSQMK